MTRELHRRMRIYAAVLVVGALVWAGLIALAVNTLT